jgi:hypothetical protein
LISDLDPVREFLDHRFVILDLLAEPRGDVPLSVEIHGAGIAG